MAEIVRDEDWAVEFVPGSWAEGLERLQRQEIDLMVSVAYSPERGERMNYTYESVAELWGQVFVRPEGKSVNISDLNGQRVGVMRRDISGDNFIRTAGQMEVLCRNVEYGVTCSSYLSECRLDGIAPTEYHLGGAISVRVFQKPRRKDA